MYGTAFFVQERRSLFHQQRSRRAGHRAALAGGIQGNQPHQADRADTSLRPPPSAAQCPLVACRVREPPHRRPQRQRDRQLLARGGSVRWRRVSCSTGLAAAAVLCVGRGPALVVGGQEPAQRAVVVVSDLHMGAGRDDAGRVAARRGLSVVGRVRGVPARNRFSASQHASISSSTATPSSSPSDEAGRTRPAWTGCWRRTQAEVQALASFANSEVPTAIVFIPGDHDSALAIWQGSRSA